MSHEVLIDTRSVQAIVTNSVNVSATSITEPVSTITVPSGDGVIALGHAGQQTSSAMKLWFFGVGTDSNTFLANLYGWEVEKTRTFGNFDLWIPTLLASFNAITLDSAQPGVALTDVPATNFFATGIALVTGNSGISVEVVSPGHTAHQIAHVVVDTKGCRFMEVRFGTGSSATSCNAMWKRM